MDSLIKRIEYKLDLLLKERQIMGENNCIHEWVSPEPTKESMSLFLQRGKIQFRCSECGTFKEEGVMRNGI